MKPVALPACGRAGWPKLGFFPGSTIGNMVAPRRSTCCARCATTLGEGAQLLIGMDLIKDVAVLEAAYDDAQGVTAGVQPQPRAAHQPRARRHDPARQAAPRRALERHLGPDRDASRSDRGARRSRSPADPSRMARGETIHTENSHKFDRRSQYTLLLAGGWTPVERWLDRRGALLADSSPRRHPAAQRTVSHDPGRGSTTPRTSRRLETLHLLLQLIGKLPTRLHPWVNHGWHVALRMTPRGADDARYPGGGSPLHRRARLARRGDPVDVRHGRGNRVVPVAGTTDRRGPCGADATCSRSLGLPAPLHGRA